MLYLRNKAIQIKIKIKILSNLHIYLSQRIYKQQYKLGLNYFGKSLLISSDRFILWVMPSLQYDL